jgi:hypothetical protein
MGEAAERTGFIATQSDGIVTDRIAPAIARLDALGATRLLER